MGETKQEVSSQKKRGIQFLDASLRMIDASIAIVLFLVTGVAHRAAYCCATKTTNGCAFKATSGLVTNDAAKEGAAESTRGSSALGVRAGRGTATGEKNCGE